MSQTTAQAPSTFNMALALAQHIANSKDSVKKAALDYTHRLQQITGDKKLHISKTQVIDILNPLAHAATLNWLIDGKPVDPVFAQVAALWQARRKTVTGRMFDGATLLKAVRRVTGSDQIDTQGRMPVAGAAPAKAPATATVTAAAKAAAKATKAAAKAAAKAQGAQTKAPKTATAAKTPPTAEQIAALSVDQVEALVRKLYGAGGLSLAELGMTYLRDSNGQPFPATKAGKDAAKKRAYAVIKRPRKDKSPAA